MDVQIAFLTALVSYLVGSLSFARIIYRLGTGQSIEKFQLRDAESGKKFDLASVSASTVGAALGAPMGMLVSLLDILKAVVVVWGARLLYPGQWYFLIAAVFVLAGHVYPVYHRFKGSGGYSVMLGSLVVIDWLAVLVLPIAGPLIGMLILRSVPAALLIWVVLLIPWMALRMDSPAYIWYAVATNVVFILGMLPQAIHILKKTRAGEESIGNGWMDSTPMGRSFAKMARFFGVEIKL